MPLPIPGAAPPRATIKCPLCEWSHTVRELKCGDETLAGVFGFGVMASIEMQTIARQTEDALQRHLGTHELIEWVRRVTELERLLEIALARGANEE